MNAKLAELKHELKVTSNFVKNKKLLSARNLINKKFHLNQKSVFREWKNKKIDVRTTPSKVAIKHFWSEKTIFLQWKRQMDVVTKRKYCNNTVSKNYQINLKAIQQVLSNTKNIGAPSPDNIIAYAIKRLPSTHTFLAFVDTFENAKPLPGWLVKGKTILLPKNQVTEAGKNYRPIACLNIK